MSYHVSKRFRQDAIVAASDEQLDKWASDPECVEHEQCIAERTARAERAKQEAARVEAAAIEEAAAEEEKRLELLERRKALKEFPFDSRTEVSADAKHIADRIVHNLWGIWWATLALCLIAVLIESAGRH
jgi:hypothetical protein